MKKKFVKAQILFCPVEKTNIIATSAENVTPKESDGGDMSREFGNEISDNY